MADQIARPILATSMKRQRPLSDRADRAESLEIIDKSMQTASPTVQRYFCACNSGQIFPVEASPFRAIGMIKKLPRHFGGHRSPRQPFLRQLAAPLHGASMKIPFKHVTFKEFQPSIC